MEMKCNDEPPKVDLDQWTKGAEQDSEEETLEDHQRCGKQCEACHKTFISELGYAVHARNHIEASPHQCQICQKRFNNPSNMRTHLNSHTEEKTYKCENCHKTFRYKSNFKAHLKTS